MSRNKSELNLVFFSRILDKIVRLFYRETTGISTYILDNKCKI